jgi:hypothetical protein
VPSELLPTNKLPYRNEEMRIAPKTSLVGIQSNAAHVRELSRGARSRLSRHGFDGALQDTPLEAALGTMPCCCRRCPCVGCELHPLYQSGGDCGLHFTYRVSA